LHSRRTEGEKKKKVGVSPAKPAQRVLRKGGSKKGRKERALERKVEKGRKEKKRKKRRRTSKKEKKKEKKSYGGGLEPRGKR